MTDDHDWWTELRISLEGSSITHGAAGWQRDHGESVRDWVNRMLNGYRDPETPLHTVKRIKELRRANQWREGSDPDGDVPWLCYCTGCGFGSSYKLGHLCDAGSGCRGVFRMAAMMPSKTSAFRLQGSMVLHGHVIQPTAVEDLVDNAKAVLEDLTPEQRDSLIKALAPFLRDKA